MRRGGELVQWNDTRGFGFIRDSGNKRHFVHIKSIAPAAERPAAGMRVTFVPKVDERGRPNASEVVLVGPAPVRPDIADQSRLDVLLDSSRARLAAAAVMLLLAAMPLLTGRGPDWLILAYLILGIASIVTYWLDKGAAEANTWRISEAELHGIDIVGGIAGGLVAQALLRHKTRKPGFVRTTWRIAVVHIVGLAVLAAALWLVPPA